MGRRKTDGGSGGSEGEEEEDDDEEEADDGDFSDDDDDESSEEENGDDELINRGDSGNGKGKKRRRKQQNKDGKLPVLIERHEKEELLAKLHQPLVNVHEHETVADIAKYIANALSVNWKSLVITNSEKEGAVELMDYASIEESMPEYLDVINENNLSFQYNTFQSSYIFLHSTMSRR